MLLLIGSLGSSQIKPQIDSKDKDIILRSLPLRFM